MKRLEELILEVSGQPVKGHDLPFEDLQQAAEQGRVLEIYYWSSLGDGEASFGFAKRIGLDYNGGVHPTYIVFPKPIPESLRRKSPADWEDIDEVYAAFGITSERVR